MSKRKEKLEHQIQKELIEIIRSELDDPRVQDVLLSVTKVRISNDLRHARAFISSIVKSEERGEILDALNAASGYIQALLGKRLKIKFTPTVSFDYDDSIEYGSKIEKILDELDKKEHGSEDSENNRKE